MQLDDRNLGLLACVHLPLHVVSIGSSVVIDNIYKLLLSKAVCCCLQTCNFYFYERLSSYITVPSYHPLNVLYTFQQN